MFSILKRLSSRKTDGKTHFKNMESHEKPAQTMKNIGKTTKNELRGPRKAVDPKNVKN